MRHYCLGGCSAPSVCARRSRPVRGVRAGTWCCVSPVSPFPPRVSRAACGGSSRPGVPYPRSLVRHSTRSVRPASPLRVWALALPRRPLPPPWVVWRAHHARSRHWALVGPFRVVRAPPRVLPRSLAQSGVLGRGGGPVQVPPYLAMGCGGGGRASPGGGAFHCCERRLGPGAPPPPTARPLGGLLGSATHVLWARACWCGGPTLSPWPARPVGAACRGGRGGPSPYLAWGCAPPVGRVRGVRLPGGGLGGGGACAVPPVCAAEGGTVGRGVALPRSVPLPPLGRQQSGCHWRRSCHGGRCPQYHSGSCSPAFTGRDLCGVLARWRGLACSPGFLWEPAAGAGGRDVIWLLSRAGRGGTIPPASGGGGRGPRGLWADGGGGCAAASLLPLWVAARGSLPWPPSCRRRTPPRRARSVVVTRLPRGGGMRGGPWTAPQGVPSDLNPPSALPEWAMVMGGSWGVRPQYCSGAPPWAAPRLGLRAAPALAQLALHKTHIWANSLKPVCFLCFLLFWCPLLPVIETGTLKIYTKMVLYMKNEFLTSNTPSWGLNPHSTNLRVAFYL